MRPISLVTIFILVLSTITFAESDIRRYLYITSPDGAQSNNRSGTGILIFDIDNGHKFVRRIDVPIFREGLRGFTGSLANKSVYYSTTNRRLGCINLETDKVVWDKQYERGGCDRTCITMDGKTLYAPTGWWWRGDDSGFLVIDASNGELIKRIAVGKSAHNSIASLDGKFVYLGTTTKLTQFRASDGKVIQSIKPVGQSGVFPYTVDSLNRYAYVCLGKNVGFDVVDLKAGKQIHRVFASDPETDKPIKHRTHGAGMTPDEKELWISDQKGKKLFIFDMTEMPPVSKGFVKLSTGGHGWVCFSRDGRFAYSHSPDVFDVRTKRLVATLKDQNGKTVGSSKFVEVQFRGDKVVYVGNEFGLGRVSRN